MRRRLFSHYSLSSGWCCSSATLALEKWRLFRLRSVQTAKQLGFFFSFCHAFVQERCETQELRKKLCVFFSLILPTYIRYSVTSAQLKCGAKIVLIVCSDHFIVIWHLFLEIWAKVKNFLRLRHLYPTKCSAKTVFSLLRSFCSDLNRTIALLASAWVNCLIYDLSTLHQIDIDLQK